MTKKKEKTTFIPKDFRPKVKGEQLKSSKNQKNKILCENFKLKENVLVCLFVKDDSSQTRVIQKYQNNCEITFLIYDDLGSSWNFTFYKGVLTFYDYLTHTKIIPKGIYNRPYCPESNNSNFHLFNNFLRVLICWKGKIIGANMNNFQNSSKGYQSTTTIRQAIKKCQNKSFKIPKSYFIKGKKQFEKLIHKNKSLIVKSCSGIRSEVTTYEIFKKWKRAGLNDMVVFFQQAIHGKDIRVHRLDENYWPIILHKKQGSIDYRYAKRDSFSKMKKSSGMKEFCDSLAQNENIRFVGIDFIKVKNTKYCLESNPNPGWAGFHRATNEEKEIANFLIKKINGES